MLRFGSCRAVESAMRSGGRYILGIDALPRGTFAAVAVGRTISATFAVATETGHPLPLEERVRIAVREAERVCGGPPTVVRLVCVDDGAGGEDLTRIHEWVTEEVGAELLVLDFFETAGDEISEALDGPALDGPALDGIDGEAALSAARACQAVRP